MAVRVIADFTMKEGWCEKIRAMLEDEENGLNLTIKQEGCIDIDMAINMDDPNRIILTEDTEKEINETEKATPDVDHEDNTMNDDNYDIDIVNASK